MFHYLYELYYLLLNLLILNLLLDVLICMSFRHYLQLSLGRHRRRRRLRSSRRRLHHHMMKDRLRHLYQRFLFFHFDYNHTSLCRLLFVLLPCLECNTKIHWHNMEHHKNIILRLLHHNFDLPNLLHRRRQQLPLYDFLKN